MRTHLVCACLLAFPAVALRSRRPRDWSPGRVETMRRATRPALPRRTRIWTKALSHFTPTERANLPNSSIGKPASRATSLPGAS